MKNFFFGLIALFFLSNNSNAQNSMTNSYNDENVTIALNDNPVSEYVNVQDNNVRLRCKKINIGINIFIAWASADVYLICGGPITLHNTTGCIFGSEEDCDFVNTHVVNYKTSGKLNLKTFFKDTDISKVEYLEITKSETWVEEDGTKTTIKLGKYPVDKEGNFELEILLETK
jgi:hypothetical protein